jgi:hypothetical protein
VLAQLGLAPDDFSANPETQPRLDLGLDLAGEFIPALKESTPTVMTLTARTGSSGGAGLEQAASNKALLMTAKAVLFMMKVKKRWRK